MAKYNLSKSESKRLGIPRVRIDGGGSTGGGSRLGFDGSDKTMSQEAAAYLKANGITPESGFAQWVLNQDFGSNLNENEAERLSKKWIDSSQSSTLQNLATTQLPDEAFEAKPQLIPGTPEYEDAWNNLDTSYFDILQEQMNASTAQEQSAAQYNWETLKKSIESTMGVTLADDAFQAWNQLQGARAQYGNNNISGSGLENESMDSYLNNARRSDSSARVAAKSKEDENQMEYYRNFATPEQIAKLVENNKLLASSWGLVPSDEIKARFTPEALKEKYPAMSDQEIQNNITSMFDGNGNYRSNLYQTYMTGSNVGINQGNIGESAEDIHGNVISTAVKPSDSGYLDISAGKDLWMGINAPMADQAADAASRLASGNEEVDDDPSTGTQISDTYTPTQMEELENDNPINLPKTTPGSMLSSAS